MKSNTFTDANQIPRMLTAKDIQAMGFSRPMVYQLLNRADMPTVRIGKRVFVRKDRFLEWLDTHSGRQDTISDQ